MKYILMILIFVSSVDVKSIENDTITGKFIIESEVIESHSRSSTGLYSSYTKRECFLIIDGQKYELYRYSRKGFAEAVRQYNELVEQLRQEAGGNSNIQLPLFWRKSDFYIYGHNNEHNQYCKFEGDIDHDKKIIYSSKLVKVYNDDEITKALKEKGE